MTLPDKEDFLAWKASLVTQWVFQRLRQETSEQAQALQDQLLNSAAQPPEQWAQAQPQAAYLKGLFDRAVTLIESEYEDFLTTDETEALKKSEEQQ